MRNPRVVMVYPTLVPLLCAVLFLQEASCRLHHRHHHLRQEENHIRPDEAVDERLALEHSERVAESGTCGVPRPQVIHVTDHYPDRYFLPHCTVLHRCGGHSGCCGTELLRCVVEEKERVVLPFYSVRMVVRQDGVRETERRVEKLTFTNHTKCGCAPTTAYHRTSRNDL